MTRQLHSGPFKKCFARFEQVDRVKEDKAFYFHCDAGHTVKVTDEQIIAATKAHDISPLWMIGEDLD